MIIHGGTFPVAVLFKSFFFLKKSFYILAKFLLLLVDQFLIPRTLENITASEQKRVEENNANLIPS